MALVGLQIFPMIFMALFIMINRMMNNRHEFIIQLTIFFGGYALTDADTMHFKADDIALVLSFIFTSYSANLRLSYAHSTYI